MARRLVAVSFVVTAPALCACSLLVATDSLDGRKTPEGGDAGQVDGSVDASIDALSPDGAAPPTATTWTNGHAYEVKVTTEGISWFDARDMAIKSGGHLVTLTSFEENAFVRGLVVATTNTFFDDVGPWMGAYQAAPGTNEPNGGWSWVTGEPWSFTDWQPGQPDDEDTSEHYAHFLTGRTRGGTTPPQRAAAWCGRTSSSTSSEVVSL